MFNSLRILLALLCYCVFLGTEAAVCSGGCEHGICVTPGTCQCDPGWIGNSCDKEIPVKIPGLEFTTGIEHQTSPPSVNLCLSTKQSWEITPFIEASNLSTCVALSPTPSEFLFQADGKIGIENCQRLEARAIVSYIPKNLSQNCYYMEMDMPLTIESILNAFCIDTPLPSFIGDMGFPDGFAASYSAIGCYLRSIDLDVSKGLNFKGTLSFWGLRVEAEVQYSRGPPNSFYTKLTLPVVKLFGDALFISESSTVMDKGPLLEVSIGSSVSATSNMYVCVLKICKETTLSIIGNELSFLPLSGSILGLFQARVSLSGEYKPDLSAMNFKVVAELKTDFFSFIINKVKSIASNIKKEADLILTPLEGALSAAQKAFDLAAEGVRSASNDVRGFEDQVAGARREVDRLRNKIDSVCRIRSCGSVSVPYPCGLSCSWRGCNVKTCHKRVSDPGCETANAGCRALKAPWELLLRAAEATLRGFERALSEGRGALQGAESLLRSSTSQLNDAKADLGRAKSSLGNKLNVVTAIVQRGLDNLLEIHSATLEGMLDVVRGGKFAASIDMTIIGKRIERKLTLTLSSPIELIDYAVNYIKSSFRVGRKRRSGLEIGAKENNRAELSQSDDPDITSEFIMDA